MRVIRPTSEGSEDCAVHLHKAVDVYISIPVSGFPCGSAGRESACSAGDLGSIAGLGRSPGEGKGSPLQYSGLENSKGSQSDTTE